MSTRGVLALMAAAKAHALWHERDFVTPADVKLLASPVLAHRLLLRSATSGTCALLDDNTITEAGCAHELL